MLDGEKFPAAILVQFSSTRFCPGAAHEADPPDFSLTLLPQISISTGTLLQPSRAASTCHLANSDSPWRPQQGTNFLPGPSKSGGVNVLLPSPPFVIFFLKKWSISLLTPWYLPRVHQRQRQEADCWGWLRCQCCWLQGLNCDDEKKTKKSLSLKTLLEGGHYFCGGLVPGPAALPPWWILHKHWDVLGWRLAHKDTLCQGVISVKEMEVGFS